MEYGIAILALGVVVLGFLLLRAKKKEGASEAQIERAENEEAVREIISERLKQIKTRRANTSTDERLRNIKYRD